jgi:hypothetical protein
MEARIKKSAPGRLMHSVVTQPIRPFRMERTQTIAGKGH